MQCIQLRRGDPPAMTVDVVLSGSFNKSYTSVEIDGTKYTSAQTVSVKKGTSVTVIASASNPQNRRNCEITLNGNTVAQGGTGTTSYAKYSFTVTDNCSILFIKNGSSILLYYSAAITMPAT